VLGHQSAHVVREVYAAVEGVVLDFRPRRRPALVRVRFNELWRAAQERQRVAAGGTIVASAV